MMNLKYVVHLVFSSRITEEKDPIVCKTDSEF